MCDPHSSRLGRSERKEESPWRRQSRTDRGARLRPHPRAGGHARAGRQVRPRRAGPAVPPDGRRGVVAAGGLPEARPRRAAGRHDPGRRRRPRPRRVLERADPPGAVALESGRRALVARAREPVREQPPAERRRRAAPPLPAGPRGRHAGRRARAHRAGRRLGRDRQHGDHREARRRPLPAARPQALHHERPDRGRDPRLREDGARARARAASRRSSWRRASPASRWRRS